MSLLVSIFKYLPIDWSKIDFFGLICSAVFLGLIFIKLKYNSGRVGRDQGGLKTQESEGFWKVGLVHAIFSGYAYPSLFAFFGSLGLIKIAWMLFSMSGGVKSPEYLWFVSVFQSESSIWAYFVHSFFYFAGIWVGIILSFKVQKQIFQPERGRPVWLWSIFWLIMLLAGEFFLGLWRQTNQSNLLVLGWADALVRIMAFTVISRWYLYRILVTRSVER